MVANLLKMSMAPTRNRLLFGLLVIAVLGAAGYLVFGVRKPARTPAIVTIAGREFRVEVADTPWARGQGLSGRTALSEDEGMLFTFDKPDRYGFWMKEMQFPIDIVWIRRDRVVGITESVQVEPEKSVFELSVYYPPEPVDRVLELNAGEAARYQLRVGEAVSIVLR